MGRSLQFRVYEHQLIALFRLGFPTAPHFLLNLAGARNSLAHSSIGTPSLALRLLVDIRFQVLFHSAPAVLFTFPSRYYALSVVSSYFALDGGPPCFPQGSSCPVVLWIPDGSHTFCLRGSHPLCPAFPDGSARSVSLCSGPQPRRPEGFRFGRFPFRSPLLRESLLIPFPPVT